MSTYSTPIPGAAGYAGASLLANTAFANAKARIAANKSSMLRSYGYTQGADGSLGVDPNNPYGKFQQMLGGQASASDHQGDLARAGGFSSGYGNAAGEMLRHQQGAESAQLGQGLAEGLGGLQDQENQAAYDKDAALYQAQQQAAQDAIQNQAFNPANFSGVDVGYGEDPPTPTAKPKAINQVIQNILGRGVSPALWAQNHPALAKQYGISPVKGANANLVKAAIAARRKGGR